MSACPDCAAMKTGVMRWCPPFVTLARFTSAPRAMSALMDGRWPLHDAMYNAVAPSSRVRSMSAPLSTNMWIAST